MNNCLCLYSQSFNTSIVQYLDEIWCKCCVIESSKHFREYDAFTYHPELADLIVIVTLPPLTFIPKLSSPWSIKCCLSFRVTIICLKHSQPLPTVATSCVSFDHANIIRQNKDYAAHPLVFLLPSSLAFCLLYRHILLRSLLFKHQ